jgi:hypothetical protein
MSTSSHSSRWQKGQSGNPGGRPKVIGDLQEQARQWSGEALEALREVATSKDAPRLQGCQQPSHCSTEAMANLRRLLTPK